MPGVNLIDGSGPGFSAKVNENLRLYTNGIVQTEAEAATDIGNSYNLNTGIIAYTGTSVSSLMYLKNNEDQTLVVTAIAVGLFDRSATITDDALITLIRNPTTGDIVSDATAVDMNQNRNFGSDNTLTADVFKGKDGGTVTNGGDIAKLLLSDGRSFFTIDWELPKGKSLAATVDLNTSGGANMYCAFICHLKDPKQ